LCIAPSTQEKEDINYQPTVTATPDSKPNETKPNRETNQPSYNGRRMREVSTRAMAIPRSAWRRKLVPHLGWLVMGIMVGILINSGGMTTLPMISSSASSSVVTVKRMAGGNSDGMSNQSYIHSSRV